MQLYIIRHGDPDYANDTLTELGQKEALSLVDRVKAINPDFIYSSPMGRAQKTALPSCRALEKVFEILPWAGEDIAYMQPVDFYEPKRGTATFSYPEGLTNCVDYSDYETRAEKLETLMQQSDAFMLKHGYAKMGGFYFAEKPSHDRICVFCHGGFGSSWIAYLLGMHPMFGFQSLKFETASITKIVFHADKNGFCIPYIEYLGDNSHVVNAGLKPIH